MPPVPALINEIFQQIKCTTVIEDDPVYVAWQKEFHALVHLAENWATAKKKDRHKHDFEVWFLVSLSAGRRVMQRKLEICAACRVRSWRRKQRQLSRREERQQKTYQLLTMMKVSRSSPNACVLGENTTHAHLHC